MTKWNKAVNREKCILPSVDQILGMPGGAKTFRKLKGDFGKYPAKTAKCTTFITPLGKYIFNCLPFGKSSVPEHFQSRKVTEGLNGVACPMDHHQK